MNANPAVIYNYESVTTLADGTQFVQPAGQLPRQLDPQRIIYIIDPATDQFTGGTITEGEVFALMRSAALCTYLWDSKSELMTDKPEFPPEVVAAREAAKAAEEAAKAALQPAQP